MSDPWCSECRRTVDALDACESCGTDVLIEREGYPRSFRRAVASGRFARAAWLETRHADRWMGRLGGRGFVLS